MYEDVPQLTGIMSLEVFTLSSAAQCYIVEVDLPPEMLNALANCAADPH